MKGVYMAISLFVGNLPYSYDYAKLTELFSGAGTVVSAKIISDKYLGSIFYIKECLGPTIE